jgi:DNA-binding transcriptional ArsR family regulator
MAPQLAADPLSTTFAALADPTRRAILARLAAGEASVTELAAPFTMSLPAVSRHLKVLERAGLIARGREAQWRPCRLEPEALRPVDAWLDDYRQLWAARFDRLDRYLSGLQASPTSSAPPEASATRASRGARTAGRARPARRPRARSARRRR